MTAAFSIRVRGVVQGVGFRPFIYRLARENTLNGWVLNNEDGVEIYIEGPDSALNAFIDVLESRSPAASNIAEFELHDAAPLGLAEFTIRESERRNRPEARISPDLPVCEDCLRELFDPAGPRFLYPYINCTNCGPRYSVILGLPYDRPNTTMESWPLDDFCVGEYHDPFNRRFHAQPVACHACGPEYFLKFGEHIVDGSETSIREAARMLRQGGILAIKGTGGYHLACDAENPSSVAKLRERKFRKEKPFAVMVRDPTVARRVVALDLQAEHLLTSISRPIVLAPARIDLENVAPGNRELGVMLPYTPLHHLLFAFDSPDILVMTSANRSSEPIAYQDDDAFARLSGIADAFLAGERPIARRIEDSVARSGVFGPMILRRSRGHAPAAVAAFPVKRPLLALGADLKNTITLVVAGQAFVSQHIGDLSDYSSLTAFRETVHDLLAMYEVNLSDLLVVCDSHPQYLSTMEAHELKAAHKCTVQHHRAHIASALAERGEWQTPVLGVSFDGTGYGDDGSIWGGEFFTGSVAAGFDRVAHLRSAFLPGGDAAAKYPVQAAAGFLDQLEDLPDLIASPFYFAERYSSARKLLQKNVRNFQTTSVGRLFDGAAALLGFTRPISYEGQAPIWLEQLARSAPADDSYPFPFVNGELDFRPLLKAVVLDRMAGREVAKIARAFQLGFAAGLACAVKEICHARNLNFVVLSGGVFQNELLLEDIKHLLSNEPIEIWTNHAVPANDGGISLGQAAIAAFSPISEFYHA